ncbi:MAG: hypothetical protein FJX72_12060 [Armatimonadetes bacterium]|nr:hypothetical protein [Armatimonadota bacterium]
MIPFGKVLDARRSRPVLPANPSYSAPPLTVECLAKLDGAKGFNILVANEPKSSATHWEMYTYAGTGVLSVYMPGYSPSEIRSDALVVDGKWRYCAMTFDGRTVRLYVDAKMVKSESVLRLPGMPAVAGPLGVGDVPGTGIGCDGLIDEVRVSSVIRPIAGIPAAPFEDDADTLVLMHFDPAFAGTGLSALADPFRAGAEAALRARKALGGGEARAVIVFDNLPGDAAAHRKMIEGIGWFFDMALVYGCNGFGPMTRDGNAGTVGVLALGEAVTVASACAEVAGDHEVCGAALGRALRAEAAKVAPGRVAVLLGDCHVPANDALVKGFVRTAGPGVAVVGGSCPQNGFVYDKGVVKQGANIALLLSGDFRTGYGLHAAAQPDQIAASARDAAARAVASEAGGPALVLVFDCVSRMQALGANAATELEAIRTVTKTAPLFGFYGSGEIGMDNAGAPPRGVGAHVAVCAMIR